MLAAHRNGGHKLEVLGRPLHVVEGAPDVVEVEDDAPEHHAHDVSAEADARHTQDQDLLAEVLDSSQVAAVVIRDDQQHLLIQSVHLPLQMYVNFYHASIWGTQ